MLAYSLENLDSAVSTIKFFGTFAVVLAILISLFRLLFLPRIKGWLGERKVSGALRCLNRKVYRVFDDLYLPRPDGQGTTQVDHVVVSRFGIFVIETKNYRGWIFGSVKQKKWTQTIYQKKSSFQNPLHQNALHIRALEQFLGLEATGFHSIIFFVGDCTFKTELPSNVLSKGLVAYIVAHQTPVLSSELEANCVNALEHLQNQTDRKTAFREHRSEMVIRRRSKGQSVSRPLEVPTPPSLPDRSESLPRDPNVSCPLCGAPMVERIAKRGSNAGNKFLGCSTFPRCRGIKSLR